MASAPSASTELLLVEQYASRLLDFSSQYGGESSYSYAAINCLGKPERFPNHGDSAQAYAPQYYGRYWVQCPSGSVFRRSYCDTSKCALDAASDFLDVSFEHALAPHAVYVYETFNPGAVAQIWAGDCAGRWWCMWRRDSSSFPTEMGATWAGHQPRAFSPPIVAPAWPVSMLRIVLDHAHLPYHAEIDSIALLGTLSTPSPSSSSSSAASDMGEDYDIDSIVAAGPIVSTVMEQGLGFFLRVPDELAGLRQLLTADLTAIGRSVGTNADHVDADGAEGNGYFDLLPREVILHIFRCLNDLRALCRLMQVCRLFRDVGRDPGLYTRLCLRPLFGVVSDSALSALADRAAATALTHLDLSWCGTYGRIVPNRLEKFFAAVGDSLTHLRLNNCHVATSSVLTKVTLVCTSLVELSLSGCQLLEADHFSALAKLTGLKHLNLARTKIEQKQIEDIVKANMGLQSLNVSNCVALHGDDLCSILTSHPLISLELWRVPHTTARALFSLASAKSAATLQELDVGWCSAVDAATGCIVVVAKACKALKKIFLTAHRQTSDRDVDALAALPNLRQLDLTGAARVTPAAARRLVEAARSLVLLDISYCDLLEDPTLVMELRAAAGPACHVVSSSLF